MNNFIICKPLILITLLFILSSFTFASSTNSPNSWDKVFPHATSIGKKQLSPPVWPIYQVGNLIGYLFHSQDVVALPAFSGKPVSMLIGIDLEGKLAGIEVIDHQEPIFLHGLGEQPLFDFVKQYAGLSILDNIKVGKTSNSSHVAIDGITKATISVVVINETILLSSLKVARKILDGFATKGVADISTNYQQLDYQTLLKEGYITKLELSKTNLVQLFDDDFITEKLNLSNKKKLTPVVDLRFAYLNPPMIGKNLLGEDYELLMKSIKEGEHAIGVWSYGAYHHVKEDFVPASIPDRLSISQNNVPIEIRDLNFYDFYEGNKDVYRDAVAFNIFRIKPQSEFDPGSPWTLSLTVGYGNNPWMEQISAVFPKDYQLPNSLYSYPEIEKKNEPLPLWLQLWYQRTGEITILTISLVILTCLFIYQHQLSRRFKVFHRVRWFFLIYTLIFIGWYTQGQLSVVNIFPILQSLFEGFNIQTYLMDPIIFILWSYVFVSLFLIGRGLFCGWLCPFGALQEVVGWLAKRWRIRQLKIAYPLHKKLQLIKYGVLVLLLALSLYANVMAEVMAEVEPFKTTFTLMFVRSWPFVIYALVILGLGLYINKFYCRYVCPLGAGLSLLGRFHPIKWLSRRKECGSPCTLCHHKCDIKAILPSGAIDYNECIQCFECIAYYNNDSLCPPQKQENKRLKKLQQSTKYVEIKCGH
jgi:NosR/NirI family nitrous oxide reductase transcriptional regulator